jgi:hypothetical protein
MRRTETVEAATLGKPEYVNDPAFTEKFGSTSTPLNMNGAAKPYWIWPMPLSEAVWQSQLVKAARDEFGGWAIKMAALQRYGCPDLLIQLPNFPAVYIECKIATVPDLPRGGNVTVAATALQRETLKQIQAAGGLAGIWILTNDRLVLVTTDPFAEFLRIGDTAAMMRERGRPWPLTALIHRMGAP